ncbi:ABC transporter ATP-binding protein [Enterococcus caccae]|uniref:ABC-type quaternary amine transporter n=1 Tax=Enterococcus caccae ATCC BAA-1240 TaxID=1158612 RepID=R3TTV1_9ENTE|nr:ABC transporter ATP-binding protein [Enterococcus caccae]EOL44603.1 spermidine/putrescine ABC transporter ATP-binding protein [Enterococcus caccae ATCC BAA-1240]EOT58746.1 spermidine/putrescine ABC transporter ATP-binding protein [Enterococcus caccae ATCC BAA-1240]OJG25908.1 spermidine/putrescine ABC transporter ATP-binding protein [Enterococcus caccae]
MTFVDLKEVRVSYDGKQDILKDLSISMEKGELVSLLGPSGCGKTTTLRVIAGLIKPNDGSFKVDEEELTKVPVHKRNFGMVFQSYALFPHLTIAENVAFGLKLRKESKVSTKEKVEKMLEVCGLENLGDRYPKQLSGGQRQRVALARALIIEPKLLLLDEPLSNLDAKLRVAMRIEIKRIQQQLGITTVFVTHDQEECFSISDKVAIMNNGVIEQYDSPERIYRLPKTKFVAQFIGFENFFTVTKNAEGQYKSENGQLFTTTNPQPIANETVATIRPEDIDIVSATTQNTIEGTVLIRTFLGKSYQYEVMTPLGKLLVNGTSEQLYETGDTIHVVFPADKLVILEK